MLLLTVVTANPILPLKIHSASSGFDIKKAVVKLSSAGIFKDCKITHPNVSASEIFGLTSYIGGIHIPRGHRRGDFLIKAYS